MTKNAKNLRNLERARGFSELHKNGSKGPAKTTPKHNKRVTYRTNPEVQKRIAEQLKATRTEERTSGRKILQGAGGASKE